MPIINVQIAGKVSADQKVKISEGITEVICKVTGKDAKYCYVVIQEIDKENFAIGGKLLG